MFEIELTICIKMDLALNNLQYAIKPQPTNQSSAYEPFSLLLTCISEKASAFKMTKNKQKKT